MEVSKTKKIKIKYRCKFRFKTIGHTKKISLDLSWKKLCENLVSEIMKILIDNCKQNI